MVFQNNLLMGAGGQAAEVYEIDESCRFTRGDSAYLYRTPGSASNRRTWTFSSWVKRGTIVGDEGVHLFGADRGGGYGDRICFGNGDDTDNFNVLFNDAGSGRLQTTALYRDPSAWYHFVVSVDTTQGTAADRVKIYVNGDQVTAFDTASYPAEDLECAINNNVAQHIGSRGGSASQFMEGYLAEVCLIDGTALDASSFGETNSTTGQWVPIDVSDLTFGTNGFLMAFQDSSALGDDTSGNGNDYTSSGLAATDQVTDTPTNNYCTWNPLDYHNTALKEGNLNAIVTADGGVRGTQWVDAEDTDGHYFEMYPVGTQDANTGIGIASSSAVLSSTAKPGKWAYNGDGTKLDESSYAAAYGDAYLDGETVGVLIKAGTLTFYNEGVSQGTHTASITGLVAPFQYCYGTAREQTVNFGAMDFVQTVPTGAKALNTANIDDPATADPSAYFQTTLYTGDGASSLAVNQGGNSTFEPDFVWIKNIDATDSHILTDSVRGATKLLVSNTTAAEVTDADTLTAFDSDGFTVGDDVKVNTSGEDYVGWQWIEGATPGFDIVSFTGNATNRTISHSLSAVPKFMIVKNLADTDNWAVYHASNTAAPATDYLILNTNALTADDATVWNDTAPTSSVFSVGTSSLTNGNTEAMIAYLWAEVEGFSKAGAYVANASTNGPFLWCGFRPAWVIFFSYAGSGAGRWMLDSVRSTYNPAGVQTDSVVQANSNAAGFAGSSYYLDFLSNGFKIRTSSDFNSSGRSLVFMAFAEAPFKTANAR